MSSTVLLVDDEPNLRRMLGWLLPADGYPRLDALPKLLEAAPGLPVVMMSGRASLSDAVKATRLGAIHFIEKPLSPEAVLLTLASALELRKTRELNRALRAELGDGEEMVGRS